MSEINIPPKVWKGFLETFSERHAGWLVQVETHDTQTDENVASQISALHSIEFDDEDEKNPRINVIVLFDSKELKHILFRPSQMTLHISEQDGEDGSEGAGREVASQAGKQIKKTVLELGGSDPFIVMPSADLDVAAATAVKARTINNGESCIAAKRFVVAGAVYDEFERRFVNGMSALRLGDPMDDATDIGPLATENILQDLDAQVQRLISAGARVLAGGKRLERPGNFYMPTVLTNIDRTNPTYREELFGPVAMLLRVGDVSEAIQVANETSFGLAASVWTNDLAEQQRFIDQIEAGVVFVNNMVASDPRLPFGGVKHSGYGRELSGHGLREFTNIKTICIAA